MKKQEKTHFEDFLKNLFWEKNNSPEINPGVFSEKKHNKKRSENGFKNILNQIENKERKDLDDFSAFLWQKHFQKHKSNFKNLKSRDYLNRELNPHAHIDIFLDKDKKEKIKINISFSPIIIFTTAIILAIFLTASAIRFNPLFAEKMVRTTDSLILNPIKLAYCSFANDILCDEPANYVNHLAKLRVDKNLLSSYIINNQNSLKKSKNNTLIQVSRNDLDGRVAGVTENIQSEASPELKQISRKKPEQIEKERPSNHLLDKAFDIQKDLFLKLQNKLINVIF